MQWIIVAVTHAMSYHPDRYTLASQNFRAVVDIVEIQQTLIFLEP